MYKAVLGGVQTVAVKVLQGQEPGEQAKFCREVAILRSCRNSHIVQFLVRTLNGLMTERVG